MKLFKKVSLIFFMCVSAFAFTASLWADATLTLSTGEVIKGTIVGKNASGVLIKTAYSQFLVPYKLIESESIEAEISTNKNALASEEQSGAQDDFTPLQESEIIAQEANLDALVPPLFDDSGSSNRTPLVETLLTWRDEYKNFISQYIPEGWNIVLSGGYLIKNSTTKENITNLAFSAKREWAVHDLSLAGYYNYTLYTPETGVAYSTTDKYGLSYAYHWNFLGENSGWFFNSNLAYKRDSIKLIDLQLDQVLGVGYSVEFAELGMKFSLDTGPSMRYLEENDMRGAYIPSWAVNESFTWDITDMLRLEQTAFMMSALDASDTTSIYVMVGLVIAPKAIVSLALRYTGDYDNSSTALKYEERFVVSLEIPLDGRSK